MTAVARVTDESVLPPPAEMRVGSNTDPHDLAVALLAALHGGERVNLRTIGAGAVAVAVKAVTIAGEFVRQRRGAELAIVPAWMTVKGSRGDDLSGLVIKVFELEPTQNGGMRRPVRGAPPAAAPLCGGNTL